MNKHMAQSVAIETQLVNVGAFAAIVAVHIEFSKSQLALERLPQALIQYYPKKEDDSGHRWQ